jgi:transposase
MPIALSIDLRQRIVEAYDPKTTSCREVAERFSVGEASVNRFVNRYRRTGSVAPRPHGGGVQSKLQEPELATIRVLVVEKSDRTRLELIAALAERCGVRVSPATMGRALMALGLTRKKNRS